MDVLNDKGSLEENLTFLSPLGLLTFQTFLGLTLSGPGGGGLRGPDDQTHS